MRFCGNPTRRVLISRNNPVLSQLSLGHASRCRVVAAPMAARLGTSLYGMVRLNDEAALPPGLRLGCLQGPALGNKSVTQAWQCWS